MGGGREKREEEERKREREREEKAEEREEAHSRIAFPFASFCDVKVACLDEAQRCFQVKGHILTQNVKASG